MYCEKHEKEGNKLFKSSWNLEEHKRVMEATKKITCPECRKRFLNNPEFKDISVEQFLEL